MGPMVANNYANLQLAEVAATIQRSSDPPPVPETRTSKEP